MASVEQHLVRQDPGLALLFTPPFDRTTKDPGYIKGYPPGLRENGGQYSHAAMWAVMAFARLGQGDKAADLFALLNPINHTRSPAETQRYKAEPYVIAADVYSTPPHEGRAGWSWYTGSAGWMYRAGVEGLLGLTRQGKALVLDPCLPADWPEVSLKVRHGQAHVRITIENPHKTGGAIIQTILNGVASAHPGGPVTITLPDGDNSLRLILGLA